MMLRLPPSSSVPADTLPQIVRVRRLAFAAYKPHWAAAADATADMPHHSPPSFERLPERVVLPEEVGAAWLLQGEWLPPGTRSAAGMQTSSRDPRTERHGKHLCRPSREVLLPLHTPPSPLPWGRCFGRLAVVESCPIVQGAVGECSPSTEHAAEELPGEVRPSSLHACMVLLSSGMRALRIYLLGRRLRLTRQSCPCVTSHHFGSLQLAAP